MKLQVVVERGRDGFHVARRPPLKGCWSQGRTQAEALVNLKEAIQLYLESGTKFKPTAGQKIFRLSL
ncbi:MAG: type II toxin-antitoxin system HicB family antitoxin [Elusimicrobiota bacterium]